MRKAPRVTNGCRQNTIKMTLLTFRFARWFSTKPITVLPILHGHRLIFAHRITSNVTVTNNVRRGGVNRINGRHTGHQIRQLTIRWNSIGRRAHRTTPTDRRNEGANHRYRYQHRTVLTNPITGNIPTYYQSGRTTSNVASFA